MWKREEPVRLNASTMGEEAEADNVTQSPGQTISGTVGPMGRDVVNIGKSVIIKGDLSGSENLTIEGQVDGKIELRQHVLTVGPNGKIKAQVFAKVVVVMGEVHGNITATDNINIRENGSVDGDISAPRVAIAEGAHFRGSIDMQRSKAPKTADTKHTANQAAAPSQVAGVAH